jgi:hypothetical protein
MADQSAANWLQSTMSLWLTPAISLAGAAASWAAFSFSVARRRSADRVAVNSKYDDLAKAREIFWRVLREAYGRFRVSSTLPEDIEGLIESCNMPPDIPRPRGKDLRTWAVENQIRLGSDQRALWQFCSEIYPARESGAIVPKENTLLFGSQDAFHQVRGNLSRFWNSWIPVVGFSYMEKRFKSARLQVVMLCWLECALILQTLEEGGGKDSLFKFGRQISNR